MLKRAAPSRHSNDSIGIAHTRWATHGGKTDENAHPHCDSKNRVALVHNGTIENSHELRHELEEKAGIVFRSQTDTEVIAQLIGYYLDNQQLITPRQSETNVAVGGLSESDLLMRALEKTLSRLEGTWGLAILYHKVPGQIVAARNGSPLCVGLSKGRMFLASELSAFARHTSQYISLNDGEVAVLKAGQHTLDMSRIAVAPEEHIELSPAPHPHWTIKEILEQPEAIARSLNFGARFDADGLVKLGGLEANSEMLLKVRHLMIAACGTSLFAGAYGALLFRSLRCFDTVQAIDASEVNADSFPGADGGCLVLSQSGETKDTHRAIVQAANLLLPCISVVNAVGSLIARTTGCGVYVNAGREHAVASTKAFTTQVTVLALIAGWYAQKRDVKGTHYQRRHELNEAIHRLPIYTGMTLRSVRDQCKQIAESIKTAEHLFVLGKGYCEPIAREGALKIKEITYAHAEGYGGGALKHGPFALLVEGTPVILLILNDAHADLMRIAGAEVKARGANVIVITDDRKLGQGVTKPENIVVVPSNGPLTALLAVVPLQLLAYELAIKRGIDPDKPRNLAKAVTVD